MANSYNINDGFSVNAPYPIDARMFVGTGLKYTLPTSIPSAYLHEGLKAHNIDIHITWEVESLDTDASSVVWKNISFGVEPIIFNSANTWLNEDITTINGLVVGENITLSAVTFGHVKKIIWTITRPGGTTVEYNKDSFVYNLSIAGNYLIDLSVEDYFGNTYSARRTTFYGVSEVGVTSISQFTVSPSAGLKQTTLRDYNFYILLSEDLEPSEISSLVISYGAISTTLINEGTAIDGVIHADNEISITGNDITNFDNKYLENTTTFTATLTKTNGQTTINTVDYTSVSLIAVNNNPSVTKVEYSEGLVSTTVTLTEEFDEYSSVIGVLRLNGAVVGSLATADSRTFLLDTDYELSPGNYTFIATLTQTVGTETYSTIATMLLEIAATTYATTFRVWDDLSTPERIPGVTIVLTSNGFQYASGVTDVNGEVVFNLEAGVYAPTYSLTDYTSEDPTVVVVSTGTQTIDATMIPTVSIETAGATTPELGNTMIITYTLSPDDKYETDCTIEYVITPAIGDPETITKTQSTDPDYNTLLIDNDWGNGATIDINLTTYYNTQENEITMTRTIGVLPAYWGIILGSEITTPRDYTSEYFATNFILADIVTNERELSIGSSKPTILFGSASFNTGNGWGYAAFPNSVYSPYLYYWGDITDPSGIDITTKFYTSVKTIGADSYTIYFIKGNFITTTGNMGVPIAQSNTKFSVTST